MYSLSSVLSRLTNNASRAAQSQYRKVHSTVNATALPSSIKLFIRRYIHRYSFKTMTTSKIPQHRPFIYLGRIYNAADKLLHRALSPFDILHYSVLNPCNTALSRTHSQPDKCLETIPCSDRKRSSPTNLSTKSPFHALRGPVKSTYSPCMQYTSYRNMLFLCNLHSSTAPVSSGDAAFLQSFGFSRNHLSSLISPQPSRNTEKKTQCLIFPVAP